MPDVTFTDARGRDLIVNTPDESMPSANQLDKMFAEAYPDKVASGPLETTVGAVASGVLAGGEGMLMAGQGAMNIAGAVTGQEMPQTLGDMARVDEQWRKDTFGKQESIPGKALEILGSLPAVATLMMGGPGAGIAMSAAKFGALSAVQTKGANKDATWGDMSWSAAKGAATGAILGKASVMGPVAGTAGAGFANATMAALEGGDTNDVIAGAIVGAGLNVMSNPKNLAAVWNTPGKVKAQAESAIGNIGEVMKAENKNPIDATIKVIENKANDYYANIRAMNEAPDRLADIEAQIGKLSDKRTQDMAKAKEEAAVEAQRVSDEKKAAEKRTDLGLTDLQRQKNDALVASEFKNKQLTEELKAKEEEASKFADKTTLETAIGLKRGGVIHKWTNDLYKTYDTTMQRLTDAIGANKPITVAEVTDMLTTMFQRGAEAERGGYVAPMVNTPMMNHANKIVDILMARSKDDLGIFKTGRGSQVTSGDVLSLLAKGGTISGQRLNVTPESAQLAKTIPFSKVKAIMDEIKSKAPGGFGSHEADIVRTTLGDFAAKKLDSREFYDLQASMSDALSMKQKIYQTFQVPQGSAFYEGAESYMRNLFKEGKGDPKMLDALEKGMDIAGKRSGGLGDISSGVRAAFDTLGDVSANLKRVGANGAADIIQLGQEFTAKLGTAEQRGQLTIEHLDAQYAAFKERLKIKTEQMNQTHEAAMKAAEGDKVAQKELNRKRIEMANAINDLGYLTAGVSRWVGAALKFGGRAIMHHKAKPPAK